MTQTLCFSEQPQVAGSTISEMEVEMLGELVYRVTQLGYGRARMGTLSDSRAQILMAEVCTTVGTEHASRACSLQCVV